MAPLLSRREAMCYFFVYVIYFSPNGGGDTEGVRMLQRRIIRFIIAWLFDQMSDATLEMVNEEIDNELAERGLVLL